MKKGLICLCMLLLFSGCAFFPRSAAEISWPEKINHMEALCELDMAWKGMNYSGTMSLSLDYPDKIQLEVYGPFGDTVVYLRNDEGSFLLVAGDERFSNEKAFEDKFDITLKDFMDDITFRTPRESGTESLYARRDRYRVSYNLGGRSNYICWEGADGRICVRFLEARFSKE